MSIKKNKLITALVNQLAEQGEKAIKEAYRSREYENDLYNLHDSYGSAVYVNGVLQQQTIRYVGEPIARFPSKKYKDYPRHGREAVDQFFSRYKSKDGIQLVIVAAMFYAGVLEHGGGGISRKYKVISGGLDILERISQQYKGSTVSRIDYTKYI